jgi:hypothetical protein
MCKGFTACHHILLLGKKKFAGSKSTLWITSRTRGEAARKESAAAFAIAASVPGRPGAALAARQASRPPRLDDHLSAKAFATVGIHDKASNRVVLMMGVR